MLHIQYLQCANCLPQFCFTPGRTFQPWNLKFTNIVAFHVNWFCKAMKLRQMMNCFKLEVKQSIQSCVTLPSWSWYNWSVPLSPAHLCCPPLSKPPPPIAPLLLVLQQYPLGSTPLWKGGLLRLRTNKTACQAALTLHPYRLFLTWDILWARVVSPPQTPTTRRGMLYALLRHCLLDTIII